MPISALDIILMVPLLILFVTGFKRGLVDSVIGLLGQVLAIFIAFTYMYFLADIMYRYFNTDSAWVPLLSFVTLYLIVIAMVKLLIRLAESALEFAKLSFFNMLAGGIFGVLKAALVMSVLLIFLGTFNQPDERTRKDSLLYPYILPVAPKSYDILAKIYPGVVSFTEQAGNYLKNIDLLQSIKGAGSDQH